MKIDLIYTGLVNLGFNSIGKGGMNTNWINLGLGYLGAILRNEGYQVVLHDLRALDGWDDLAQRISSRKPEFVGVQINTPNLDQALVCCKIAKQQNCLVIAGGPHATLDSASLLDSGLIDYVVVGEGEIVLPRLIRAIERNNPPAERLQKGEIVQNLDDLPYPAWDLYPLDRILNRQGNFPFIENGLPVIASRGCHANCSFCQPLVRRMFGSKVRYRSPENVIGEIKTLINRFKLRYFSFQDDTFTANKAWVLELCKKLRGENLHIQWSAQSRVDTFDEEIAMAMKRAGCVCVFFGIESGSQRILNLYRKGITPEKSLKAAKVCKKAGLIIFADFIFGGPTETPEEMKQTVQLIREIGPELPSPTFFTPIPGCDLHEFCKKEHLILGGQASNFDRSPQGRKIKGIDYGFVRKCLLETLSGTPIWFQRRHFAHLVLKRWVNLLRHGDFLPLLKEVVDKSLPEMGMAQQTLRKIYRRMVGR